MNNLILEFEDITKQFFGIRALDKVSLGLAEGHVLGLIGENGAGKTTLVNILGGVLPADEGKMRLAGTEYAPVDPKDASRHGVGFIHQELNLFTNLNIAENIFIDRFPKIAGFSLINKARLRSEARTILDSLDLELSPTTKVESLSPGEKQLVEIAKALSTDAKVIIFDEPTTSLTAKETRRLFDIINRLKKSGKSIIYISHILADVLALADEVAVLRDGKLVGTGPKAEFTINRMISLMVGRDIDNMYPQRSSEPMQAVVFEVKEISQIGIVKDIHFALHKGEVLGIFGLMGSGRTELARIIFGIDPYEKGQVNVNGVDLKPLQPKKRIEQGVAFVTEDRRNEGLLMALPIAENLGLVSLPVFTRTFLKMVDKTRMYASAKEIANTLQIKSGDIEQQHAKSLSGGNQQKTVIGKWLLSNPNVLIMDEPTRGIDVGAKYEVYTIINDLASQGTGILLISSEIEELIGVCDRILVMNRGEIVGTFAKHEFDQENILRAAFRQNGNGNTHHIKE
jgi:ribose transport system ATP-binding protein